MRHGTPVRGQRPMRLYEPGCWTIYGEVGAALDTPTARDMIATLEEASACDVCAGALAAAGA